MCTLMYVMYLCDRAPEPSPGNIYTKKEKKRDRDIIVFFFGRWLVDNVVTKLLLLLLLPIIQCKHQHTNTNIIKRKHSHCHPFLHSDKKPYLFVVIQLYYYFLRRFCCSFLFCVYNLLSYYSYQLFTLFMIM